MSENGDSRMVWSCSLLTLPEENEVHTLAERLRAGDGSFWADAEALRRYLRLTGMSQADCARRLGRSQSGVANRLRLFKLPEDVRQRMRAEGLSERHARALLRLKGDDEVRAALEHVLAAGLNVAETEAFVERRMARERDAAGLSETFESLLSELERLRRTVPGIGFTLEEAGEEYRFCITLPKKRRFSE